MDLVYSSFGLEHLLREIGQIYETVVYQSDVSDALQRRILDLPTVAAELLIDGYPLELMDGDAAHVPIAWVTAVLNQIQKRLCDPPLLVLSICLRIAKHWKVNITEYTVWGAFQC